MPVNENSLPRMTGGQFHRAKRLIRRLCANYDGGNCLPLEDGDACPCPQFITRTLICKYFRAAVLPADRALWSEIMAGWSVKRCRICGASVVSRSNAVKYCRACALLERQRRDRERKQARTSANRGLESLAPQDFQNAKSRPDKNLYPQGQNGL